MTTRKDLGIYIFCLICVGVIFLGCVYEVHRSNDEKAHDKEDKEKDDRIKNLTEIIDLQAKSVEALEHQSKLLASLSPLKDLIDHNEIIDILKEIPQGTPFTVPICITASFGISEGLNHTIRFNHKGIDLIPAEPENMQWQIKAFASGIVSSMGYDLIHGKNIIIQHSETYRTRYSHLEKIYYAGVTGEHVTEDTIIGWMGATGLPNMKPHGHFQLEVFNGEYWIPINPEPFLLDVVARSIN